MESSIHICSCKSSLKVSVKKVELKVGVPCSELTESRFCDLPYFEQATDAASGLLKLMKR